mgnify:CR=1 FL=1
MNAKILDIPSSEYHQLSELSRSQLATFRESPYGYMKQHIERDPEWQIEVTPAMEDGTLLHSLVLDHPDLIDGEPQDFPGLAIIPQSVLSKSGSRAGGAWTEFAEMNAGQILRKSHEVREIWAWAKMLCRGKAGDNLFCGEAKNEQTVIWQHECNGNVIDLRARLDRVILGEAIVDLKTCGNADMNDLSRTIASAGYDFQAAMYRWAWYSATGELLPFRFVFIQKDKPYLTRVYEMSEDWLSNALGAVFATLEALNAARLSGNYQDKKADVIYLAQQPKYHILEGV